jgi:hypothetical protein
MKTLLFKKKLYAIVILFAIACSSENKIEENNNFNEPSQKTDYHEDWMAMFNNYEDLEKIVKEEKKNMLHRSNRVAKSKRITSKKPILVHYMPWFKSLKTDGIWGQHWTMTNKNPDIINAAGEREIASHYYPLIGPYSTKDIHLQQYHLLLMKLAGVDGVIFDWYGKRDVLDFEEIKLGMESFVLELQKTNLGFSVMYEDRVIEHQALRLTQVQLSQAIADFKYIEDTYLAKRNYTRIDDIPLLMIFGPSYINNESDWSIILNSIDTNLNTLGLWNSTNVIGSNNVLGEYAWIDKNHLTTLSEYYSYNINFNENTVGGVAYPRFNDFYLEGGWRSSNEDGWSIDGRGINVFKESFEESLKYPVDFIQVATWNDFGEGTQIEPTNEYGFLHLEMLQDYTETTYKKEDLRIPYYIYKLRKKHLNSSVVGFLMDVAYWYAMNDQIEKAKQFICITIYFFGDDFL